MLTLVVAGSVGAYDLWKSRKWAQYHNEGDRAERLFHVEQVHRRIAGATPDYVRIVYTDGWRDADTPLLNEIGVLERRRGFKVEFEGVYESA